MVLAIERFEGIAVVTLDNPPVNALGYALRRAICDAVAALDTDPQVRAVVLMAAGRTFCAGADISEFDQPPQAPLMPEVILRIEGAAKPWLAAIHGAALGGGLELVLGCHYRIAASSARLGLPEVTLGIVPGAGGTVRLPRLIAIDAAVEMITAGRPVGAEEALRHGLLDAVVTDDLRTAAIAFAARVAGQPVPTPLGARDPLTRPDAAFWDARSAAVTRRARGAEAPGRALACVRRAVEADAAGAFAFERKTFETLRDSDQARALRHVFFAERAAARPAEIEGIAPTRLERVAVIGGGTMGVGIAAALRDADLRVILVERDDDALARSRENFARIYDGAVARGKMTTGMRDDRIAGARFTTDDADLAQVDLVIEAVFEDLDVKRAVFARLDAVTPQDAVLATNTSYLDPNAIAAATARPERVIGLHFFSPAQVMRLLEIVPADASAPDVVATGFALARRLGKIPVRAGICEGFIGNRILKTTRVQLERLLLAGANPQDVDRAMAAFGMPMGPFAAQDLAGLDISAMQREAARKRGETPFAPIAERLCAAGRLGQKTGAGWYDYAGSRTAVPSDAVAAIIAEERARHRLRRPEGDLADMIVLPMVDEAARILAEGIARRPADIDLVEIHGYGFPRWRGGLMFHAETRGLAEIARRLTAMAAQGLAEPPCHLLVEAARAGSFSGAGGVPIDRR